MKAGFPARRSGKAIDESTAPPGNRLPGSLLPAPARLRGALEETLAAMDELVRAGKVRYPAARTTRLAGGARCSGWRSGTATGAAIVTQPMYNLLARGIEQEYLPMCREFGVATVVYNPLAGGLLTGKQRREAALAGTRFDKNQMYLDRYWHSAYFDAVEELRGGGGKRRPFAGEPGAELAAAPYAGGLRHPRRFPPGATGRESEGHGRGAAGG